MAVEIFGLCGLSPPFLTVTFTVPRESARHADVARSSAAVGAAQAFAEVVEAVFLAMGRDQRFDAELYDSLAGHARCVQTMG
jgi:hypothetical protein